MTNIVILCHDRYRLTVQCLESIRRNTDPAAYTLTLVDDESTDFRVRNFLDNQALYNPKNTTVVRVIGSRHCLGALKNLGVRHSEMMFGRGEWLCVLDNDVCVFPGWLEPMQWAVRDPNCPTVVGGVRHPYHKPNGVTTGGTHSQFEWTDAVAGYCHFMTWKCWELFGPYVTDAGGIGQSEDFAFCREVVKCGDGVVGYVTPPIMAHCGITNSKGELISGHELIERVPGVLYL